MRRRTFSSGIVGGLVSAFSGRQSDDSPTGGLSFEALFEELQRSPYLLEATRSLGTGMAMVYERGFATKSVKRPRANASSLKISERAEKLIVLCEVTSEATYDRRYKNPIRPGGQSGVTIGVGYDLGYITPNWLVEDWNDYATPMAIERLRPACGLKGEVAHKRLNEFQEVEIPWSSAWPQFRNVILPRFVGETNSALPNCDRLSPDCLGALTSLTFNRGPSYSAQGPRYAEMRNIRQHMMSESYARIPAEILAMRRIWIGKPDMRGVVVRREAEAALFQQGLTL